MSNPIEITTQAVEDRAVRRFETLALEDPDFAVVWAEPASRLLLLQGARAGVALVFEAIGEAGEGGDRS